MTNNNHDLYWKSLDLEIFKIQAYILKICMLQEHTGRGTTKKFSYA